MATKAHRSINPLAHPSPSIWAAAILLSLLILTTVRCAEAQSSPPSTASPFKSKQFNPSYAFIIVVVIIGFFLAGFLSVYLRPCASARPSRSGTASDDSPPAPLADIKRGLDPSVLASFPTMPYAKARELKLGLGALECAVCLLEFEDDETLKLLPRCCHVYHSDCIDAGSPNTSPAPFADPTSPPPPPLHWLITSLSTSAMIGRPRSRSWRGSEVGKES